VRSILIADDNPHAQRMGSQILGQAGHKVFTLSNGDQVHSFVAEHHPDVAILDLRMPGVSGVELCRRIKSDYGLTSTKVLLLAGPLDQINSAEVDSAGSDGVIQKPLDAHTLTTMIDGLFDDADGVAGDSISQPPERPISLVDPPPPPSPVRAFSGNGAPPTPGRRVATNGAAAKVNGSPAPSPGASNGAAAAQATEIPRRSGKHASAPPSPAPPPLEVASDEVMEELSDVMLGDAAPPPPKARPRENGNGYAAVPARTNGSNGSNGHASTALDPFAALVQNALGNNDHDAEFEARVAQIVDEVVRGAMHTIREQITHEVIESYRRTTV